MSGSRQLIFDILANNKASKAINDVGSDLDRQQKSWDNWKKAGVVASGAIAAGLGKFGADSIEAYTDAQKAQAGLANAFTKFPALADTNVQALQDLNSALARKTGYDDDEAAAAQASLAQFKLTGDQITTLTPLLEDYAAKTGVDLPTAADQLGKAMLGQGRALKGVGVDFKDTGSVAGNFDEVVAGLTDKVGGYAEMVGGTAAGKTAIMKDQVGELQEMVGEHLVPAVSAATSVIIAAVSWMTQHQAVTLTAGAAVGTLAAGILIATAAQKIHSTWTTLSTGAQVAWNGAKAIGTGTVGTWLGVKALELAAWVRGTAATVASTAGMVAHSVAMGAVRVATAAWTATQWLLNAALDANPIGIVVVAVAALVAGILYLWNHCEGFRNFWLAAWEGIKIAAKAVADWWTGTVVPMWDRTWSAITGFFSGAKDAIVNVWNGAMDFFKAIPGRIGDFFAGVGDFITRPFRSAFNAVADFWNGTIGKLSWTVPDWVPVIGGNTLSAPKLPHLAVGGVATAATLAVIGEAGREAVLPYDRVDEFAAMVARNLNPGGAAGNAGIARLHPDDIAALADAIVAGAQIISARTVQSAQADRTGALTRRTR